MKKKIKKRLLSLTLAVLLITALAIPASAQTIHRAGSYDGCTYAISAECGLQSYYSVIEYQGSEYGDYTDYIFQASAAAYICNVLTDECFVSTQNSIADYRVAGVSQAFQNPGYIDYVDIVYRINGGEADTVFELSPG